MTHILCALNYCHRTEPSKSYEPDNYKIVIVSSKVLIVQCFINGDAISVYCLHHCKEVNLSTIVFPKNMSFVLPNVPTYLITYSTIFSTLVCFVLSTLSYNWEVKTLKGLEESAACALL